MTNEAALTLSRPAAEQLFLSPHTARDHIKAIFEKTQVSSRGELVGKLFVEHYRPAAEQSARDHI
jgi:hypothetical protein